MIRRLHELFTGPYGLPMHTRANLYDETPPETSRLMKSFSNSSSFEIATCDVDQRGTVGVGAQSNPSGVNMRDWFYSLGRMRFRALGVLAVVTLVLSTGCHKFEARVHLKEGN